MVLDPGLGVNDGGVIDASAPSSKAFLNFVGPFAYRMSDGVVNCSSDCSILAAFTT